MLIYNHKKEFIGIDEHDLKALGFSNLSELRDESADFEDLFVKTPGYIHNFKHVHWIDFITCAESNEDAKVIIHVKNKNYRCILDIKTAYLIDNPTQSAFLINLSNIRELSHKENEAIAGDLLERVAPKPAAAKVAEIFDTPELNGEFESDEAVETESKVTHDPYEVDDTPLEIDEISHEIDRDSFLKSTPESDFSEYGQPTFEETQSVTPEPVVEEDVKIDLEDIHEEIEEEKTPPSPVEDVFEEERFTEEAIIEDTSDYVYDPHVASSELGLPIDLIEEFIQDFINQAKEFKEELFTSLAEGKIDNVRVLSHKLKGVAANLRIEDAHETLIIINTSDNTTEVETNLKKFYNIIIPKLSGEEIIREHPVKSAAPEVVTDANNTVEEEPSTKNPPAIEEPEEDELILSFKDEKTVQPTQPEELKIDLEEEKSTTDTEEEISEPLEIADDHVPDRIEVPELADDEFLNNSEYEEKSSIELEEDLFADPNENNQEEELSFIEEPETEEKEFEEELQEIDEPETLLEINTDYDKNSIANEIGLDKEGFESLFADYILESNAIIADIQNAISEHDTGKWRKETIKLKGMSENMRINHFKEQLKTLLETDDAKEASDAIKVIDLFMTKISKVEDQ